MSRRELKNSRTTKKLREDMMTREVEDVRRRNEHNTTEFSRHMTYIHSANDLPWFL